MRADNDSLGSPWTVGHDGASFSQWINPHLDTMVIVAKRYAGPNDRDDVLQAALLAAWRSQSTFDPSRGSLRAWLVTLTANEARRLRKLTHVTVELVEFGAASSQDESIDLKRAISKLSRRQREVVELHYYVGLAVHEVAQVLGCSDATVKTMLVRARARIHKLIGANYVES